METGKTSKYLKYAIGEIVLVVVGILIALQVNNWNEHRKTNNAEQLLLNDLKEEMNANLEQLKIAMDYHSKSRRAAKQLLLMYRSSYKEKTSEELDSLLAMTQWAWTYDPSMGALNAIKLSGHMNSVRNVDLRKLIASYEDLSKDTREEGILLREMIVNKYIPSIGKYVNLMNRLKFLGDAYVIDTSSKFISDYEGLFNDRAIENLITYIHTWRIDEQKEEEDLLSMMESFITTLENEISND